MRGILRRPGARAALAAGAALLAWSAPKSARGEWLAGASREVTLGDSASPDAPVTGYAFGPRARAGLGVDVGLVTSRGASTTSRLGVFGSLRFEDATGRRALPSETERFALALSQAWSFDRAARDALGPRGALELGLTLGRRASFTTEGVYLHEPWRSDDVPFGAGGFYLGVDGALRARVTSRWQLGARLGVRVFTNAWPDLFGASEASNVVADQLREGAAVDTSCEVGVRWLAGEIAQPLLWLHLDTVVPHDDNARTLWLGRTLLGLGLPGRALELVPFVDVEAGHGQGVLVNRTELRLGAGVALHAR